MASSNPIENYYAILEVTQQATIEVIVKSYKRLALKLHPDRNARPDATAAFQRLGHAYDTLKDADKRRAYDLIFLSTASNNKPNNTHDNSKQQANPSTTSSSDAEDARDKAEIARIEKSREARAAKWRERRSVFESGHFEMKREVTRLESAIRILVEQTMAEMAEEQRRHSLGAWVASFIWKEAEESEEEKEKKDRAKQERMIEKDLKDRRLDTVKRNMKIEEVIFEKAQTQFRTADGDDERKIRDVRARIQLREDRRRWERQRKEQLERERLEKIERERQAKLRKQREEEEARRQEEEAKKWQDYMETLRKQQKEERVAREKRRAEDIKHREKMYTNSHYPSYDWDEDGHICDHGGWWTKVQGRAACPECSDVWTYLLKCPGCARKACPKCQSVLRPRRGRY